MSKLINLHISPSQLSNSTRILKEAGSLIKLNLVDEVHLVGFAEEGLPLTEKKGDKIFIHRILINSNSMENKFARYLNFIKFFIKTLFSVTKIKANIVNCHGLHVLPIGVLLKFFTKSRIIYDAHELETEVKGSKGIVRFLIKVIERICMPFVDELIVVSDSIGEWYKKKYRLEKFTAIYNIPNQDKSIVDRSRSIFREVWQINANDILFIYQGVLSEPRGVIDILNTFLQAPSHLHIVFMGEGPLKKIIKDASGLNSNIHFHPYVNPSDILNYTRGADVGIHIIKNTCLNHYYCLPNKIFEYFMAGIPFIVSDFPEMSNIVNRTNGGWLIEPNSHSLLEKIKKISIDDIKIRSQNIQNAKPNFGWEIEEQKYIPLYKRIITQIVN
jgi:glycosyltransferase involved in cell wall biosynthesis